MKDYQEKLKFQFKQHLNPDTYENVISKKSRIFIKNGVWVNELRDNGIFIDLSKVEFAEFSTLAQVALLIEGAVRHKISVSITLPIDRISSGEKKFISQIRLSQDDKMKNVIRHEENRFKLRKKAKNFMLHSGFIDAIEVRHIENAKDLIVVNDNYDSSKDDRNIIDEENRKNTMSDVDYDTSIKNIDSYYRLQRIFPLKWFMPLNRHDFEQSENFASFVFSYKSMGLSEIDARSLASNLLGELVENVHRHAPDLTKDSACIPYALIGGVVFDPDSYHMEFDHFRPCMNNFINHCKKLHSPMIRIVVGDSGQGIPKVLGPYFGKDNESEIPIIASEDPPLRFPEKVLLWAFNKWSTSEQLTSLRKRGTRGLWLVQSLVQSYGGSITARSEDAMVGWQYAYPEIPDIIRDTDIRFIPGTFLDLCILTHHKVIKKIDYFSGEKAIIKTQFSYIKCSDSSDAGFNDNDAQLLIHELAKATPIHSRCVIATIDLKYLSERTIQNYLLDSCKYANQGAITLLFTGVVPLIIDNAAGLKNLTKEDIMHLGITDAISPVLLLSPLGNPTWFCPDYTIRTILEKLIRLTDHHLSASEVDNSVPKGYSIEIFYRKLRLYSDIFNILKDGSVCLQFNIAQLNLFLIDNLSKQLRKAVFDGNIKFVQNGIFLTPSLVCVKRWINVVQLLRNTTGIGPVAYALARKLEAVFNDNNIHISIDNTKLVRVDIAASEITSYLSECLGLGKPLYSMPGGLDAYGHSESASIRHGEQVILCADLILSTNTVQRAIAEIVRLGGKPIAIACIYDSRKQKDEKIRNVLMVSLSDVDIIIPRPQDNSSIIYIDPVLRQPVQNDKSTNDKFNEYIIPSETLLNWCEKFQQEDVLCYGHIVREVGRHFPIYLNADKLIGEGASYKTIIIDIFIKQIIDWLKMQELVISGNGKKESKYVEIWYPGEREDFAGKITHEVIAELQRNYKGIISVKERSINRAACLGRWVFPKNAEILYNSTHVVMIDWGSITSITIQQIMRLAAQAGAVSFYAIIFLSQIPTQEEIALRRINSIISTRYIFKNKQIDKGQNLQTNIFEQVETEDQTIPAKINFLSSLQLGFYSPNECPMCKLEEAYSREELQCPTGLLQEHAQKSAILLEEHDRYDLFGRSQSDLYNVQLVSADITRIIRLRNKLADALRSTEERVNIESELKVLVESKDIKTKIAWIRFLSTEPIWLKLPPLCFEHIRNIIADIAISVANDSIKGHFEIGERRQAIIVLRAASKERFAVHLMFLIGKCIEHRELIQQLLYDTYTYLLKFYHESSGILVMIKDSLISCHDYLNNLEKPTQDILEYASTVKALLRVAEYLLVRSGCTKDNPIEAWKSLQEKYSRIMMLSHSFVEKTYIIMGPLQEPASGADIPNNYIWEQAFVAWEECLHLLSVSVLPYLQSLKKLFRHEFCAQMFGMDFGPFQTLINLSSPLFDILEPRRKLFDGFIKGLFRIYMDETQKIGNAE